MKKLLLICFLILFVSYSYAADAGSKAMTFLNIAPNARVAAIGEGFTALADDVSAVYWNPAGLSKLKNTEVGVNYNLYFEEMTYMNLQFAGLFGFGNLGLNVSTFSYGDIDNYIDGTLTGTVAPSDMMLSLSYGLMVAKDLHAGLTIKYVSEKLTDEYSGTAFAGDIGLIYGIPLGALFKKDLTQPLYIGIVAQNVGMGPQFDQEKNDLPMNIRAGLAYKIRFPSALAKLKDINLTLDLLVPTDADVGVRYGTEMWWYNLPGGLDASLRFGLKMPQDLGAASGITAGAGLRIFQVEVDYALVNFGDLGTTHRIGLTYKFGKIEKPVDEAPSAEEEEEFDFEDKPSGKNKKDDAKKAIKDKKEVKDEEDDFEFEE